MLSEVKLAIFRWRKSRAATRFNDAAARRLRPLLEALEEHKRGEVPRGEQEHRRVRPCVRLAPSAACA